MEYLQTEIEKIDKLFNKNILDDMLLCRSDIKRYMDAVKSLEHENQDIIQQYGGVDNKQLITDAAQNMKEVTEYKTTKERLTNIHTKLKGLSDHIGDVVDRLQGVVESSKDIADLTKIQERYNRFSSELENVLTSKRYRIVDVDNLKMLVDEDSSNSSVKKLWSNIYSLWVPFVTNIKELYKTVETDIDVVHDVILEQAEFNIQTLTIFEELIDTLSVIIEEMLNKPKLYTYRLKSVTGIASRSIKYEKVDNTDKIVSDGEFMFASGTVYNYMKDIELDTDALTVVETTKMKFIDEYVNKISTGSSFMDAIELDLGGIKKFNIDILEKIAKIESFSARQSGGSLKSYDNRNVSTSLLSLTNKLKETSYKLKHFKSSVRNFELEQKKIRYYMFHMMNVASLRGVKHLNIYRYVNRGILDFYLTVINDIDRRRNRSDKPIDAIYFDICHGYILNRMRNMFTFLIKNMTIDDVIEIEKCTGPAIADMVLFNHFKDILDSYYETIQNNVSIYARLNDYPSPTLPDKDNRLFAKDTELPQNISVDYTKCLTDVTGKPTTDRYSSDIVETMMNTDRLSVKFNMVFDYEEFRRNEDISKYMSIGTNISKKKSVMIVTYGYSGTGKTYTLFGNGEQKGLIQSAIEGIVSKKEIYFRTYEMYGAGVKYPFYWCDSVSETCYVYKTDTHTYNVNGVIETDIDTVLKSGEDFLSGKTGYMRIEPDRVKTFFKNFNNIVESIDNIRTEQGRIKKTPNNPVSSRSIIIYDMMIRVEDDLVRLVVMDLPGREEIVQTYTYDYIQNHKEFDTPFHRAVLSSMSIDPLYLAILCPSTIVDAFNRLDTDIKRYIVETGLQMDELSNCLDRQNRCIIKQKTDDSTGIRKTSSFYIPPDLSKESNPSTSDTIEKVSFLDEPVIRIKSKDTILTKTMKDLIQIDNTTYNIRTQPNTHHIKDAQNISDKDEIMIDYNSSGWFNKRHINRIKTTVQYQAVVAIHLLNRIVLLKDENISSNQQYSKFDVLTEIYKVICSRFGYTDYDNIARAPFEGVYINENIVGLLKVLCTDENMLNKSNDETMNMISTQKNISFSKTKEMIREDNVRLYRDPGDQPKVGPSANIVQQDKRWMKFENVAIDEDVLDEIYKKNRDNYSSQKIFLFCNPIIERVAKFYISDVKFSIKTSVYRNTKDDTDMEVQISGVKDVKIFYLFSNVNQDMKCVHQYKLFRNTLGLMELVDSANI